MAAVTKQINEAKVIANDTEQYTRTQNIRILGLPVKDGDCKETVVDFLRNKLKICDTTRDDIKAAHILPKRPTSGETADDNQTARTEPSQR